jgi:hypothetical protein
MTLESEQTRLLGRRITDGRQGSSPWVADMKTDATEICPIAQYLPGLSNPALFPIDCSAGRNTLPTTRDLLADVA